MPILPDGAQAEAQENKNQIIVNIPSRTLELYKDNTLIKEYQIAIGKPSTPTPTGEFTIIEKEVDPAWYPPGKGYVVPSGPSNPLGYRWMGIGSMYGIHGTNAPWSIGLAVSNGCMRMQEEDVEELFELVNSDTLVKVEYERIKVRIDNNGKASIGVYPDVYGRQRVTVAGVKEALAQANLGNLVDDAFLETLVEAVPDRQVVFAQLHKLKINGRMRPERIISWEGKKHIPVMALVDSLHTTVTWNEGNKTITRQNLTAPGFKRGNTIYVNVEHLPVLFGGREVWNDSQNCLELMLPVANLDGQLLSGDIQRIGDTLAVPALTLAQALGERVTWRPSTAELLVHGRPAPIRMIGGQPFVTIQDIGKVYNTAAVWDDKSQSIELSYPLYTIDYSMYLDPGEEFL
ncbi:Copper amine oxidase N-terminal domain-containing protein [Sporomusa malonica]|uniref:Copper amine oxidase N-terminal domain-containing protein n=2 Tax=Sporomusa malonica TaxID=112901 RepID=A0A1W2EEQ5_9FIRM|nr:Copper amine oxidase N-terminal domain-containing protein [Sporomusa malonica]